MNYISSLPSYIGFKQQNSPQFNIQEGIKTGNTSVVIQAIENKSLNVNAPLPNGELPLHQAVKSNQPEVAIAFLKNGADPEALDYQNLSAIDHAALMKNNNMLATLLSSKLGKALTEVQDQIKTKASLKDITQLTTRLAALGQNQTVTNAMSMAAKSGAVDEIRARAKAGESVNAVDKNGWAPIHYAVCADELAVVEALIELGADLTLVTMPERDSLLHLAIAKQSKTVLAKLLTCSLDPNVQNVNGQTPMHYAAAIGKLDLVQLLASKGGNPYAADQKGASPLAYIGVTSTMRDPLAISNGQLFMFALAATSVISLNLAKGGLVGDEAVQMMLKIFQIAYVVGFLTEAVLAISSLKTNTSRFFAVAAHFLVNIATPLAPFYMTWLTYKTAQRAFDGLKASWNNFENRPWDAAKVALVHGVNAGSSLQRSYAVTSHVANLFMDVFLLQLKGDVLKYQVGPEKFEEVVQQCQKGSEGPDGVEELLKYNAEEKIGLSTQDLQYYCGFKLPTADTPNEKMAFDQLEDLSLTDRLNYKGLNPLCTNDRLFMIDPSGEYANLNATASRKFVRDIKFQIHPDKVQDLSLKAVYQTAFERFQDALDIGKQYNETPYTRQAIDDLNCQPTSKRTLDPNLLSRQEQIDRLFEILKKN